MYSQPPISDTTHDMQRNLEQLEAEAFDLLVIGAGINGAWIALDAAQRGMRVALVDKGDFGSATSAATGRMIHGGIRYLQHLSFGRLRRSLRERMLLLGNAPHLVHPLKFLIPTSGHGMKGRAILSMAMIVYDQFAAKAVPAPPHVHIPGHIRCSRNETLRLEPLLSPDGLTGSVCFTDCQMPFPERLTLAVIKSAETLGAAVANYCKAHELVTDKNAVTGCILEDVQTERSWKVKAKCVVNAAGPWGRDVVNAAKFAEWHPKARLPVAETRKLSKGIHIITRSLTNGHGLALATRHRHSGSWLDRGGRHFFIVPWEGLSLVGTTNAPFHGAPDDPKVTEEDILGLIEDVNSVYPAAGLCREDVRHFYGGLYPDDPSERQGYQGGRRDVITDHARSAGIEGLISVTGVKFTTSRHLAECVVDVAVRKLRMQSQACRTAETVLHGGDIPGYDAFVDQLRDALAETVDGNTVARLIRHYGSETMNVIEKAAIKGSEKRLNPESVEDAQTLFGVRHEMALRLDDVLFRRTDIGLHGCPSNEALLRLAGIMGRELGWGEQLIQSEIANVHQSYQPS